MPTSFADAEQKIAGRFQDNAPAGLRIAFDNLDDATIRNDRTLDEWVRFTNLEGGTEQVGIGTTLKRYRNTGLVVVQCFIKENTWTKPVLDLADQVAAIFRGVTHDGVVYRAPSVERIGPTGGWYQVNVVVPYWWDLDA